MVNDPRERTRTWLTTYLRQTQLTWDNDTTSLTFISQFANPPFYYIDNLLFGNKDIDIVYTVQKPSTDPLFDGDGTIYGYVERVPVWIQCADKKQGRDGNKILWKAEAELRYISETYPMGSFRGLSRSRDITQSFSTWTLLGTEYILAYERDTT